MVTETDDKIVQDKNFQINNKYPRKTLTKFDNKMTNVFCSKGVTTFHKSFHYPLANS